MVSTHPGDHNIEKIKAFQISQFSAIMIFMLINLLILAPSSRKRILPSLIDGKLS